MKRLLYIIFPMLALIMLGIGLFYVFEEKSFILQSKASVGEISGPNSIVIATPSCVKADGQEMTRLYVICLNSMGLGESGFQVDVKPVDKADGLNIRPTQGTTNQDGRAFFDISSSTKGEFRVSVDCGPYRIKDSQALCFKD